jgi:hypothetical protein
MIGWQGSTLELHTLRPPQGQRGRGICGSDRWPQEGSVLRVKAVQVNAEVTGEVLRDVADVEALTDTSPACPDTLTCTSLPRVMGEEVLWTKT